MTTRWMVLGAMVAAAVTGCTGGSGANLSVSARSAAATTSTSTDSATAGSTSTTPTSLDLGNGISLDRVRLVIRKLKIEGASSSTDASASGSTSTTTGGKDDGAGHTLVTATASAADHGGSSGSGSSGSGSDGSNGGSSGSSSSASSGGADDGETEVERENDDDAHEVVVGPLFADLSAGTLSAGLQQLFQGTVPTGTFQELKLAIGPVGADKTNGNAGLEDMAAQHASVIIEGTIDGKKFTFVSGLVAQVDVEEEIEVSASKDNNVTLDLDPKAWFGGTGSARLDPTDEANRPRIEDNIKNAVRGFQDDDRRGDDDHGGNRGPGGGSGGH